MRFGRRRCRKGKGVGEYSNSSSSSSSSGEGLMGVTRETTGVGGVADGESG